MTDSKTPPLPQTPEDKARELAEMAKKMTAKTMWIGLIAGFIGVIGYPLCTQGMDGGLIFTSILLAIAAFMAGFFTGTLFGMPKRNNVQDSDYTLNNSLVEIADWLTKIIVGLGLINLKEIPPYLRKLGDFVVQSSGSTTGNAYLNVFAICVVVFFTVFGLYNGYNYMRIILSGVYKAADDNFLEKKIKEQVEKNNALTEELKKKDEVQEELVKEKEEDQKKLLDEVRDVQIINSAEVATLVTVDRTNVDVGEMERVAKEKLKAGLLNNNADPQKGQWGKSAVHNKKELSASVKEISKGAYRISLTVKSTDENDPLNDGDMVLFALHNTFGDPPFRLVPVKDKMATLDIFSYGSFTVGAFVNGTDTQLELDLADLPDVSEYFKTH